jgi:dipeptidyl aminopeptidase/acylaminoacyl peptidase
MASFQLFGSAFMKSRIGIGIFLVFCLVSCTPATQRDADWNVTINGELSPTSLPMSNSIEELARLSDVLSIEEVITGVDELDEGAYLYRIMYLSDGYTVEGYIAAPKDYLEQAEPYPVLIYNRGGNADYGAVNSNFPPAIAITLKAIVFASQYRETHEGTGKDEFGGDDVHDVIKLLDFVERCTFADKEHIIMWGESRGSIMTYEILRMDDRIRAAIVTGSVPDLVATYNQRNQLMKNMLKYRVGGTPDEVPEEYSKRSAIQWAEEINTPLLIFHTEDDTRAPVEDVDKFFSVMESFGKDVIYIRKLEGDHCWRDMALIKAFFDRHTK